MFSQKQQKKSIKTICTELELFRLQSGFTVSYDKTTLYRIGSLRHSNAQMYDISQVKWSNNDINVLGVIIAHEDIIHKNYEVVIEKTKKVLNAWYNRNLSLIAKVQVVNTLVASLFVYKMMVLPMIPQNIIKTLDNLIRDFIWQGRKSKIAYKILQNPKEEGGLNLVNIQKRDQALKATWPQILSTETEYAQFVYGIMKCTNIKDDIWRCNLCEDDVKIFKSHGYNEFWIDVLECWCKYNYYINTRIENQIIWYNSKIRIKGKPIFWADVYGQGLKFVYQLF